MSIASPWGAIAVLRTLENFYSHFPTFDSTPKVNSLLSIGQYPSTVPDNGRSRRILHESIARKLPTYRHFMWTLLDN